MAEVGERIHASELKRQERIEQWSLLSLSIPALTVIFLVVIIPIGWLFYLSFVGSDGQATLEHYRKMIEYKSYYRCLLYTSPSPRDS